MGRCHQIRDCATGMKRILSAVLLSVSLFAADPVYIVHWTSNELCHECNTRTLLACSPDYPDCNVPAKTADHFEVAASKDAALRIANEVGASAITSSYRTVWSIGIQPVTERSKGTLIAIYESRPLALSVKTEEITTPQPPTVATKTTVTLDAK